MKGRTYMKKVMIIAAGVVVVALAVWQFTGRGGAVQTDRFEFEEIGRGDIENIVSSMISPALLTRMHDEYG